MREVILGIIVLGTPFLVAAQETPKLELFGGYSLIHRRSDTMNGWDGAVTANLSSWLGITADVSGHYISFPLLIGGTVPPSTSGTADVHSHSFTFGPQLSYRKSRYSLFAHTLLGVSHLSFNANGNAFVPGAPTFSESINTFTALLGGGADISVGHRVAIRPAQLEYLLLRSNGNSVNQFRYSGGVVFRFGKK